MFSYTKYFVLNFDVSLTTLLLAIVNLPCKGKNGQNLKYRTKTVDFFKILTEFPLFYDTFQRNRCNTDVEKFTGP
jgi:hypothetical protein